MVAEETAAEASINASLHLKQERVQSLTVLHHNDSFPEQHTHTHTHDGGGIFAD